MIQGKYWISRARENTGTTKLLKMPFFLRPGAKHLPQLTTFLLTVLLATSSEAIARSRKAVQQYGNPVAAVPEDPQAYAMRVARQTWPGRDLCDDGGYRIHPCDMADR